MQQWLELKLKVKLCFILQKLSCNFLASEPLSIIFIINDKRWYRQSRNVPRQCFRPQARPERWSSRRPSNPAIWNDEWTSCCWTQRGLPEAGMPDTACALEIAHSPVKTKTLNFLMKVVSKLLCLLNGWKRYKMLRCKSQLQFWAETWHVNIFFWRIYLSVICKAYFLLCFKVGISCPYSLRG